MTDSKGKIKTFEGLVFCFLSAVCIAVVALNIGLHVEPGKILPTGLTMRSGEMNQSIIKGIELAMDDVRLIKSGNAGSGLWRLVTFVHADLFFYLALILPQTASKTILLVGYFVRFGLCCSAMYYFLSVHLKLNRLPSVLLATMFTFSTQIVLTAQFASIINMAFMFPLALSAFDSYLQKRTWKSYLLVCLASFGLCFTGGFGIMSGVPALLLISLLMCIGLYRTFKMTILSWLKLAGGVVFGLALDMAFVLPGLLAMDFKGFSGIAESAANAKVNYTVFDFLRGTYVLRSGGLTQNNIPLFYVGMLTVLAVIAFALNENIPVRLKAASAVVAFVFHITCCSSFVNETISIFGTSATMNSSRLICLEMLVFFIAGIGVRNISGLKRGEMFAVCLIPLGFLVVSNNASAGTTLSGIILLFTFAAIVGEAALLHALAKDKFSRIAKIISLALIVILVGINTAFMMFNNTVQKMSVSEYFQGDVKAGGRTLIMDSDFAIPALNDGDSYLIIPMGLSSYESDGTVTVDDLNYISQRATGMELFDEYPLTISDSDSDVQLGANVFELRKGANIYSFESFDISRIAAESDRLFVYCDAENGARLVLNGDLSSISESEKHFSGPFLTELTTKSGTVELQLFIDSESEDTCFVSRYKLNEQAFDSLKALSGSASSSKFTVDVTNVEGTCTLILPYAFDDTEITVNGETCESFDFCGKLAVEFVCNGGDSVEVSMGSNNTGLVPGAAISVLALVCIVAITFVPKYNVKKKETVKEA